MRPCLLRNNGDGTFTDVTAQAGLLEPVNSNCATWADYDNDGFLDLFVCCEQQPNRLYHNRGDGTFEEVAAKAGCKATDVFAKAPPGSTMTTMAIPDLFLNNLNGPAQLFHNNRDGTFTDVTQPWESWAAVGFFLLGLGLRQRRLARHLRHLLTNARSADVIQGMQGQPHGRGSNRLYRNLKGKGFQDVTKEAGLDMVFATMGSNFGDFDNDGYLDFYLGTGDPNLRMLVPNRMFKNVAGKRFAEITSSSGTGHLQKGHGVACGDWSAAATSTFSWRWAAPIPGDRYHNVLFQNPGHENNWLTVKLVGKKTNRAAIGARIKVVDGRRAALDRLSSRFFGKQFRRQPAAADHRSGQGGPRGDWKFIGQPAARRRSSMTST